MKPAALVFYLLFYSSPIFPQNISNLNIEKVQDDGLKNNYIICMNQDNNGYMWFGTRQGLFRYDGYNFKTFRNTSADSTVLISNSIQCIYSEKNGLWMGSMGGLSHVDINTQAIKNYYYNSLTVLCIFPENDSVFWVGTNNGLFQFNKKSFKWKRMPFTGTNASVNAICADNKGNLYFVITDYFCCYSRATGKYKNIHPRLPYYPKIKGITCPAFARCVAGTDDNLWITTWSGGLLRYNTRTGAIKQWLHPTDDLHFVPYKIILDVLTDSSGNLWLANKEGGLTIFETAKNKFINYPVEWQSENKISAAVVSLFRDRSGILWIGTENGIFKYDPHNTHLLRTDMMLKTDTGIAPAHISPLAMLKDNAGALWMGMYEGIYQFDEKKHILINYCKALGVPPNAAVFNILQDKNGVVWFTAKNLLVKISHSPGSGTYQPQVFQSQDIKSSITALYIDKEDRIWVGTAKNGIYRFDTASKRFLSFHYNDRGPRLQINEITSFYQLSKDTLLAGGISTGLLLLHTNTGKYEKVTWGNTTRIPSDVSVNAICGTGDNIWLATEYDGLWQTNIHFKKPSIFTVNDGLPSLNVTYLVNDKQGNLWLITNSGVAKLEISTSKITVFDKKDGILNLDELNSMRIDDKNNVFIGSRGCLYSLTAAQILKNNQPPKVFITNLKIFDKDYSVQKSKPIELSYNQNYFSLDYVALNYTRSKFNRYAYKMDGLDKKWNDAGPRRYVSYANLDEGTYTFNVKASNNEGVWNNVPARLVLIIKPPFWHRWWFYLSVVFVVAVVIYTLYEYNINQLKIRLQMRDKIARDLHDEIGSTLSGINIFSKIALQQMHPGQPGQELIEKISDRSKNTMDALSDIVWSINTRNDGMDNFLAKANEYLSVLEVQDIGFDFTVDDDVNQLKIGMILKKELYLIFKEAICNASKYAACSFVQINLTHHKGTCMLSISDNGKGFNISNISSGNGIYNMEQRAKKMKADFNIQSEEGKGTTVTLKFRITQYR